jgi:hypothetical protein
VFCPVDGDEYREGVTRCPEHDVDLVDEPPELEHSPSWLERLGAGAGLRVALIVAVVAAIVYAAAGMASGVLFALFRFSSSGDRWFFALQDISSGAFPVVIGAVGVLGGAVLFRAYTNLASAPAGEPREPELEGPRLFATELMRVLFVLFLVFVFLWAATGILTAKDQAEYLYGAAAQLGSDAQADDWFITLVMVNNLSYFAGLACLLVMGARLALTAYLLLDERRRGAGASD